MTEEELGELPVGTMLFQWEEGDELLESWVRHDSGWRRSSQHPSIEISFTDHMIWSPTSGYEVIYDPRED